MWCQPPTPKMLCGVCGTRANTVTSLADWVTKPGTCTLMLHILCCSDNVTLFLRNLPWVPVAFQVRSKALVMGFQSHCASRQTLTSDKQTLTSHPPGSLQPLTLSTCCSSKLRRFPFFFSPNTSLHFLQILLYHWLPQAISINAKNNVSRIDIFSQVPGFGDGRL